MVGHSNGVQIANQPKPSSKINTVVFAMFYAKDSWANLRTALNQKRYQVDIITEVIWTLVTYKNLVH